MAKITVKQNQSSLLLREAILEEGSEWRPEDYFISATNNAGEPVGFDQITVTGTVDTNTPGEYEVIFSFDASVKEPSLLRMLRTDENSSTDIFSKTLLVKVVKKAEPTPTPTPDPDPEDPKPKPEPKPEPKPSPKPTATKPATKQKPKTKPKEFMKTNDPQTDTSLLGGLLVGTAGFIAYWRKRKSRQK